MIDPEIVKQIDSDAATIAELITKTDSDYRGGLLIKVGDKLRDNSQNFTGDLLRSAGIKYGVDY